MAYRVQITSTAEKDIEASYEYLRALPPTVAERWLHGMFNAILSLREMPVRCRVIDEAAELGVTARQLLYGRGSCIHRVVFDIEEDTHPDPTVRVLRVWHGARDRIQLGDLSSE